MINNLSYSKLDSLLRCAKSFQYRYIEQIPTPLNGRVLAGRCYHHVLALAASRRQLFDEIISAEEIADTFSSHWDKELGLRRIYDELDEEPIPATIVEFGEDDPGELKDSGIKLAQLYAAVL